MRTVLVSIVIGMGVLIVLGLIALIYGLIQKTENPDFKFFDLSKEAPAIEKVLKDVEVPLAGSTQAVEAPRQAREELKPMGDLRMEIPAGYKVEDAELKGRRLMIRLSNDSGLSKLLFVNPKDGSQLGSLTLVPAQ